MSIKKDSQNLVEAVSTQSIKTSFKVKLKGSADSDSYEGIVNRCTRLQSHLVTMNRYPTWEVICQSAIDCNTMRSCVKEHQTRLILNL